MVDIVGSHLGPYQILGEVGTGGMGVVYRAEGADGLVAIKVVHPHLLGTPGFFQRFLREAEVGKRVDHPNVVRTIEAGEGTLNGQSVHYLVMEFVEGQTLRELLDELERAPEELCRHIGLEVARGLGAIHAVGVIHRDLKPENVLITPDQVVKVMDLGVARLRDDAMKLSHPGAFAGTAQYAAPEQFKGLELTGAADHFSLGLLLYELVTGQHPFRVDNLNQLLDSLLHEEPRAPTEINPRVTPYFEQVILQLLMKDSAERLGDPKEVLEQGEAGAWWRTRASMLRDLQPLSLRRLRVPRETALYGREAELAKLHALFDRVCGGDGQVVLIEGEAGIGKTRLVDEFVRTLQSSGKPVHFLFGSHPPGGAATGAGAYVEAFREQFGEAGSSAYLPQTPMLVPAFDALLRGEAPPEGHPPLNRDTLQTLVVHAARNLAQELPTILMIDDLHSATAHGLALFASLALAVQDHPILLIGTLREGIDEAWIAGMRAEQISLGRLGAKDLVRLLEDALESVRLAEGLSARIALKSDGNPYFVFEIIRALREGKLLEKSFDGSFDSTRIINDLEVPSTVLDLVHARMADLVDDEREVLEVAACCGFEFDPLLVGEVVGLGRIALLKKLGQIERKHRLVRALGRRFVFDHYQVREALYGGIFEVLREEYHGVIADAIERRVEGEPTGAVAVELCRHLMQGRLAKRAVPYLSAALRNLDELHDLERAAEWAQTALGIPNAWVGKDRISLLLSHQSVLDRLALREEQRAVLDEALALAEDIGAARSVVMAHRQIANLGWGTGGYENALEHVEKSIEGAIAIGDRAEEMDGRMTHGLINFGQGAYDAGIEHLNAAMEIARELSNELGEARALGNLGLVFQMMGRFEEARANHERAIVMFRASGDRRGEVSCVGNLANIAEALGRPEDGQAKMRDYLQIARQYGIRSSEAIALVNLGPSVARMGRPQEGMSILEECLALCRTINARRVEGHALESIAQVHEYLGNDDEAERMYTDGIRLRREINDRAGIANTLGALAMLLARQGRNDEALTMIAESEPLARAAGSDGLLATLHAVRYLMTADATDVERAKELHHSSRKESMYTARMQTAYWIWKASGEQEYLDEAKELLATLVENSPESARGAMCKLVPLNRMITAAG